jgi:hypothetical protein
MESNAECKGRRVTIDLTAAAAQEVDRLREGTGLTTADLFRNALSLLRIYLQARERGEELCVIDPHDNSVRTRIELPVVVAQIPQQKKTPPSVKKGSRK